MANLARPARASSRYDAAAICAPGLEEICSAELRGLGLKPKPAGAGVVQFAASPRQLYAANVWLRTAGRVIVRVATFRATDFYHLQDHGSQIEWSRWIPEGYAPKFRISSNDSKLYHTKAVAQRLHQISAAPSIGEPEQLFIVRIERNTVTISADSSGDALHMRAWRTELGEAPLRTTMASSLLMATDWGVPHSAQSAPMAVEPRGLVDPFCGSGTIAIEAALLAKGLPPGGERDYAFAAWTDFEAGSWASVQGSIAAARRQFAPGLITACDRDATVLDMARRNAERAGVDDIIEFDERPVSHLRARTDQGTIVTNPPFGKRIGGPALVGLYRRLGAVARERLEGYGLAVLSSDTKLAKAADGRMKPILRFRHGGLGVELFHRKAEEKSAPAVDETLDAVTAVEP